MGLYYLETSALLKLYIREPGTERLLSLVGVAGENRLAVLSLAKVELISAIRRRQRMGDIPGRLADQLIQLFKRHMQGRFLSLPVTDSVLDTAAILVDRYRLRAYDAVQLAGYVSLRNSVPFHAPVLVCSDLELLAAATQEEYAVLDPCS